jgi:hypothetical protein
MKALLKRLIAKLERKKNKFHHSIVTPLYKINYIPVHPEDDLIIRRGCLICGDKSAKLCECVEIKKVNKNEDS